MAIVEPHFFGRKKEINDLLNDLNDNQSVTLVLGEASVGKSALLNEFYYKLSQGDPTTFFVGYFKKGEELVNVSLTYPFVKALENLLTWVKDTETSDERVKGTLERVGNAFVSFAKE